MKKITLIVTLLFGVALAAQSQAYFKLNAGYNFPFNSSLIGTESHTVYNPNTGSETTSSKQIYGTLGQGISAHFAYGNSFSDGITGFEIEIGYLSATKYDIQSSYNSGSAPQKSNYKLNSQSIQLAPSFTLRATPGKTISLYAKAGPAIALTFADYEDNDPSFGTEEGVTYKPTLSIGFKSAVGFCLFPEKKIQFFSEVSCINMAYSPAEGTLTKFVSDGVNALPNLTEDQKTISYKKNYKTNYSYPQNERPRQTYSMGSISVQAGIKYVLK